MLPVALTIAGSDPSGGAGIQADLKTFHRFGVYGEAVITLVTVQNTMAVSRVEILPGDLVGAQIDAVVTDIPPQAAKTGALGSADVIRTVARAAARFDFPLVVDPVMISKHGARLISADAVESVRRDLLPVTTLLTPNLPEAEALCGIEVRAVGQMREAARILVGAGARAVLIKGGHLEGDAVDVLFNDGAFFEFRELRIHTRHTHGTGCTYSAAITALLARGEAIVDAVREAKKYVTCALASAPGLGAGSGPLNHWAGGT